MNDVNDRYMAEALVAGVVIAGMTATVLAGGIALWFATKPKPYEPGSLLGIGPQYRPYLYEQSDDEAVTRQRTSRESPHDAAQRDAYFRQAYPSFNAVQFGDTAPRRTRGPFVVLTSSAHGLPPGTAYPDIESLAEAFSQLTDRQRYDGRRALLAVRDGSGRVVTFYIDLEDRTTGDIERMFDASS